MNALEKRSTAGGRVSEIEGGWRLSIDPGPAGVYRWAQIDDYMHLPRKDFAWSPPLTVQLRARISNPGMAGTWGFGFWNDPFSASLGVGGMARRLPALPNAAWFFYASAPNYLALRDDHPAQGFLAATFRAPLIPSPLLGLALPAAPLLLLPATARLLRRLARLLVQESGALVSVADLTAWHAYRLELDPGATRFYIDDALIAESAVVPRGRLGFVLWIDNQYAAFPPTGRVGLGTLATEKQVGLEVLGLEGRGQRFEE